MIYCKFFLCLLLLLLPADRLFARIFFGTPPDIITFSEVEQTETPLYTLENSEVVEGFIYNADDNEAWLLLNNGEGKILVRNGEKKLFYDETASFGLLTYIKKPFMIGRRDNLDFLVIGDEESAEGYEQIGSFVSSRYDDYMAYQVLQGNRVAIKSSEGMGKAYAAVTDPVLSETGDLAYIATLDDNAARVLVVNGEEFNNYEDYGFYSYGNTGSTLYYTAKTEEGWVVVKEHEIVSKPYDSISLFETAGGGEGLWIAAVEQNGAAFCVVNGVEQSRYDYIFSLAVSTQGKLYAYGVLQNGNEGGYSINGEEPQFFDDLYPLIFSDDETTFSYFAKKDGAWPLLFNNREVQRYRKPLSAPVLAADGNLAAYWLDIEGEQVLAVKNHEDFYYYRDITAFVLQDDRVYILKEHNQNIYLTALDFSR
jgi:hypothetical protein